MAATGLRADRGDFEIVVQGRLLLRELVVQTRDAHAKRLGNAFHAQWLIEILPQQIDGSGNPVSIPLYGWLA
jgi:hypothetical protein